MSTLLPIIQTKVENGSIIHNKEWCAYAFLKVTTDICIYQKINHKKMLLTQTHIHTHTHTHKSKNYGVLLNKFKI